MKTIEQIETERAEVAKLDVCCQKCKYFGHMIYNREPSGQCQLKPPGKYSVTQIVELTLGGTLFSRKAEVVESPFPQVWPFDKCGEFQVADKQ